MFSLFSKQASRKYVDLIYGVSSKWANWDPPKKLEPGDFGVIDSGSGQFEKEGNIYVDLAADETVCQIVSRYPPARLPSRDQYIISSSKVRQLELSADVHANVGDVVGGAFKGQWKFDKSRGALLVMDRPETTVIADQLLTALIGVEKLRGRYLITEVFSCPGYVLYLSNKSNETIGISLQADGVLPSAVSPGAQFDSAWICEGGTGLFQKAYREEACFTPLYQAKTIRKHRAARVEPRVYVVRASIDVLMLIAA
ncbi:hypothetical protein PC9H_007177 [Pleurotus ostreatus]|uniref:Uncharacterized protein n=1 Tax=Pleurotus ostreatus TaxID=5322 RepID=A0A8H6ZQL3_PLEOS|nr:uncharacterized protein PC9H_007177 [Pleurotus ostreatus]KAF7427960.1 hypothetical protein PC9H_007177 [Pleurotus ostreatus]